MKIDALLNVPALTTPGSPAAGRISMYAKSDGIVYTKDSGGVERSWSDITNGSVTSAKLADGSVTANKLTIASAGESIILNGSFRDVDAGGAPEGWASQNAQVVVGSQNNGLTRWMTLTVAPNNLGWAVYQNTAIGAIPASPGDQFYVEAGFCSNPTARAVNILIFEYGNDGSFVGNQSTPITVADSNALPPQRQIAVFTVGASTRSVRFGVWVSASVPSATIYISDYIVRRVTVSAQIADGAISTAKIAAANVTGDKLATTLTGAHTFSGTLTGSSSIVASSATDSSLQITRTGGLVTDWNYVPWYAGGIRTAYIGTYAGAGDFAIVSETAGAAVRLQPLAGPMLTLAPSTALLANRTTVGNTVLTVQGMVGQTGKLQSWQDSAAAEKASIDVAGNIVGRNVTLSNAFYTPNVQDVSGTGPNLQLSTASVLLVNRTAVGNTPLIVKGMAAQSGDFQQWQNDAGTVLARVSAGGIFQSQYYTSLANAGAYFQLDGATIKVMARGVVGDVPLIIRGMAAQTGDLQQWQDSASVVRASIPSGSVITPKTVVVNDYLLSRGQNLVSNGTAYLGNNTNFSALTYDGTDTPGGGGGFKTPLNNTAILSDELIPVDPAKTYTLEAWAREKTVALSSYLYIGLGSYDIDSLGMFPQHVMYQAGTNTTLAVQLNPGATTITLTSSAGWNNAAGANSHYRSLISWNYVNARGYAWPARTYSRNVWLDIYADGGIAGNVITLRVPWAGPMIPAGTAVNNGSSGGTYKYIAAGNAIPGNTWTKYSGSIGGIDLTGTSDGGKFWPGTASVKVLLLPNRDAAGPYLATANQVYANFWFSEQHPTNLPAGSITGDKLATTLSGAHTFSGALTLSATITVAGSITAYNSVFTRSGAAWGYPDITGLDTNPGLILGARETATLGAQLRLGGDGSVFTRGIAAQSADLQQWQDSAGVAKTRVTFDGSIYSVGGISNNAANKGVSIAPASGGGVGFGYAVFIGSVAVGYPALVVQGITSQTANLQEWQAAGSSVLSQISSTGKFRSNVVGLGISTGGLTDVEFDYSGVQGAFQWSSSLGRLTLKAVSTGAIPLVVKAVAAQTADLQRWVDSADGILAKVNSGGGLYTVGSVQTPSVQGTAATGPYLAIGAAALTATNRDAIANIAFVVKGMAAQTGDLQQWQNSAGTAVAKLLPDGGLRTPYVQAMSGTGPYMLTGTSLYVMGTTDAPQFVVVGNATQTTNLQEWRNSSNTVLASINASGSVVTASVVDTTNARPYIGMNSGLAPNSVSVINRGTTSWIPLVVVGMAGQTGSLQEWRDSAAAVMASISSSGALSLAGSVRTTNVEATTGTGVYLTMAQTTIGAINRTSTTNVPLIARGMAAQTGNLQEWQDSAAAVKASVSAAGNVRAAALEDLTTAGPFLMLGSAYIRVENRTTVGNIPLQVKGMAGQTGDLQRWQDSADGVLARVDTGGYFRGAGLVASAYLFTNDIECVAATGPYFTLGPAGVTLTNRTAIANIPLTVKGMAAQTGDLQQWQDSAGAVKAQVAFTGAITSTSAIKSSTYVWGVQTLYSPALSLSSDTNSYISLASGSVQVVNRTAVGNTPLVVRGMAAQSGDLMQWQDSTAAILAKITAGGSPYFAASMAIGSNAQGLNAELAVAPYASGVPGIVIRGAVSQSANLQEWQDSTGAIKSKISSNGDPVFSAVMTTEVHAQAFTGAYSVYSSNGITIYNRTAVGNIPLIVQGMASQTGDLQQWRDSAGTVKALVTAGGRFQTTEYVYALSGGLLPLVQAPAATGSHLLLSGTSATFLNRTDVANTALIVKGMASQTGDLQQWQSSAAAVLARVDIAGNFVTPAGLFGSALVVSGSSYTPNVQAYSGTQAYISLSGGSVTVFNRDTVGNVPLIVKGMAGQTGNLQQWQDSASVVLASVNAAGNILTPNVEPASGTGVYLAMAGTTMAAINRTTVGNTVFSTRGMAGQTGDLQRWQDSALATLAAVSSSGNLRVPNVESLAATGAYLNLPGSGVLLKARSDVVQLQVFGHTTQTSPLQLWQTNAGGVLTTVAGDGQITAPTLSATGLAGAAAASRHAGAITTGNAPTTGAFVSGDVVVDSGNGTVAVCTASGSPGTWKSPPLGVVGYAEKLTTTSGVNTIVVLAQTASIDFKGGRKYRITGIVPTVQSTVAGDRFDASLFVGGTRLQTLRLPYVSAAGVDLGGGTIVAYLAQPSDASAAVALDVARSGGTGTGTFAASSTQVQFVLVEDMGT